MGSIISIPIPADKPANKMHDFTCALAIGNSYVYCMLIVEGEIEIGNLPSDETILAPISASGLMTRSIGREDNDSSPTKEAFKPMPEAKPSMRRKPVPELPRLITLSLS